MEERPAAPDIPGRNSSNIPRRICNSTDCSLGEAEGAVAGGREEGASSAGLSFGPWWGGRMDFDLGSGGIGSVAAFYAVSHHW